MKITKISFFLLVTIATLAVVYLLAFYSLITQEIHLVLPLQITMITAALALSFQGIFTLFWMLYGWEDPEKMIADSPPRVLKHPNKSFTLLIPARFESQVIGNTLTSISKIMYPDTLLEVLVLCKSDDTETIAAAKKAIKKLHKRNYKIVVFESEQSNKANALNVGLKLAKHEIIGVFDAEDEPRLHILNVVNTLFLTRNPAVVQGGVQLMNYQTQWFSALNVLEYYFWYKSALHLFSRMKVVPLGGNTVFFKKTTLRKHGGWQECLTEDAEIGLRLSLAGEKVQIMYHPALATAEESPATLQALFKQRTRWNQGFFQILLDGKWRQFKDLKRKAFAFYFLSLAQINAFNFILVILSMVTFFVSLPIFATIMVMFPLYLLGLQLLTQLLGYREFSKEYRTGTSLTTYVRIMLGFIPYQCVLTFGAVRALYRQLHKTENWEKTDHQNLHRALA